MSDHDLGGAVVSDRIVCSACGGCGNVELPPSLQVTLNYLRRNGSRKPSALAVTFDTTLTAMINRLEKLRLLTLVDRVRVARGYAYHALRVSA